MRHLRVPSALFSLSLFLALPGLALPGAALGARADRYHDEETFLICDGVALSDGGTAFMFVDDSQQFGDFADLVVWAGGLDPFEDPPSAISGDSSVSVTSDVSSLTAAIDLFEFDPTLDPPLGDFLGVAAVDATLTAIGDPEPIDEEFMDGNRRFRATGTFQGFAVTGTLELPDETTGDLSACRAGHVSIDVFGNNPARPPASFIFRNEGMSLSCEWETELGFVGLFADAGDFGTFSDLFVASEDSFVSGSSEDAVFTSSEFSATFELQDEESGVTVGTASASASITPTNERIKIRDVFDDGVFKLLGRVLAVDGTLEIDLDGGLTLAMDSTSCSAIDFMSSEHVVDPRGPKPKPLANDTPEGALPLGIGDSDHVLTGGNAVEPEASCVVEDPEGGEPFELPISYTAWWTFEGTGDDVTVSTTGSDFDTIVGVYQLVGGSLQQVACVDDVFDPEFSLQAVVTVATDAGSTYYIQAGGFAGSTGELIVSIE